jgi:hypothetical protein
VPHVESDLSTLREDTQRRARELAREQMRANPELARKVARILAE